MEKERAKKIGAYIKELRKKEGLTQKQLAQLCGCHPGTIQQYELGKRTPNGRMLAALAEHLYSNVASLYSGRHVESAFLKGVEDSTYKEAERVEWERMENELEKWLSTRDIDIVNYTDILTNEPKSVSRLQASFYLRDLIEDNFAGKDIEKIIDFVHFLYRQTHVDDTSTK